MKKSIGIFKLKVKNWLRSDTALKIVSNIIAYYIKFVLRTSKISFENKNYLDEAMIQDKPIMLIFWHGRLALMTKVWDLKKRNFSMVATSHFDGKTIALAIKKFGFDIIWAPKDSKQSTKALIQMLTVLKSNGAIGITPDGPKGPRYVVKGATVTLAQKSGAIVVPATCSVKRCKFLDQWDRFQLPLPFNEMKFIIGEVMTLSKDADDNQKEIFRQKLQNELNQITSQADAYFNHKNFTDITK